MTSKAGQTIASYTEVIPVYRDYVGHMAVDVASSVIGDWKYLHDTEKMDEVKRYNFSRRSIESFGDVFGLSEKPKIKLNYNIDFKNDEVVGVIGSISKPDAFYGINFPFCTEERPFINSEKLKPFICETLRNNPVSGANLVVDKYMKFFGNLMADLFKVRNYGIFGIDSPGFLESLKVMDYIGENKVKYEKLPRSELIRNSHNLINQRFLLKRIKLKDSVIKYYG